MKKIYTYLIFSFALLCSTSLIAQTNEKARETAVMIADRILKSTTYDFVDKKSGKTYTSLKNVPLNKNVKVQSKYLDWHYTNGVTNIALMELGDKLGTSKYENYVLKNMHFRRCKPGLLPSPVRPNTGAGRLESREPCELAHDLPE